MYVDELGRPCAQDPGNETGAQPIAHGQALSPGSFVEHYVYTPAYFGLKESPYTLCGYVAQGEFGTPNATGTVSFSVTSLAAIAEAEQKAAEEQAERRTAEEREARIKYENEAPAREAAANAAAQAKAEAALAAEISRARSKPVTRLLARTVAHDGRSSQDPGYTELYVTTSHYAYVTVKLTRYGHSTEHFEWGDTSTEVAETIPWTCASPGGIYRYVISARTKVGATRTVRGAFAPVSASRCRSLKRQETEARERSEHEAAEERRRIEHEERARLERFEFNCRAEGGTPITLYTETGSERGCKAPDGGLLPVP